MSPIIAASAVSLAGLSSTSSTAAGTPSGEGRWRSGVAPVNASVSCCGVPMPDLFPRPCSGCRAALERYGQHSQRYSHLRISDSSRAVSTGLLT
ncbi:hypothetical protein D3C84_975460 [compost metagenome]